MKPPQFNAFREENSSVKGVQVDYERNFLAGEPSTSMSKLRTLENVFQQSKAPPQAQIYPQAPVYPQAPIYSQAPLRFQAPVYPQAPMNPQVPVRPQAPVYAQAPVHAQAPIQHFSASRTPMSSEPDSINIIESESANSEPKTDGMWKFSFKKLQINFPIRQRSAKVQSVNVAEVPERQRTWRNLNRREAKDLATDEITATDTVIALMGPTGSGKSSFISTAIGTDAGVGHSLESCTSKIRAMRVKVPEEDVEVVLVDTPGFDDTHKSDYEILTLLSDWLKKTYQNKVFLSGILYLHRITDNRMAGTPLKNLKMFEKLCGPDACSHIVMVTTMWDELDEPGIGDNREKELTSTFWKSMVRKGSTTIRHDNTSESAWTILEQFVSNAKQQQAIQLQKELVDLKKKLPKTQAGQELYFKVEDVVKKQEMLKRMVEKQLKGVEPDSEVYKALQEQIHRLERERADTMGDLEKLRIPVIGRLWKTLTVKAQSFKPQS